MKLKRKAKAVALVAFMLIMGLALTGCTDRSNNGYPAETTTPASPANDGFAPPIDNPPPRPGGLERERTAPPDSVPPHLRHPDGTIG